MRKTTLSNNHLNLVVYKPVVSVSDASMHKLAFLLQTWRHQLYFVIIFRWAFRWWRHATHERARLASTESICCDVRKVNAVVIEQFSNILYLQQFYKKVKKIVYFYARAFCRSAWNIFCFFFFSQHPLSFPFSCKRKRWSRKETWEASATR